RGPRSVWAATSRLSANLAAVTAAPTGVRVVCDGGVVPVGEVQARRGARGCLAAWGRLIRPRLPPGDDPHALAGLGVVGDEREVPPELDDGRQLAAFVIGAADRFGGGIVDDE